MILVLVLAVGAITYALLNRYLDFLEALAKIEYGDESAEETEPTDGK